MAMTQQEKIGQLASLVEDRLIPLIDRDYVLYGLPNYSNVGDQLIWEGCLEVLKKVPFKCKGVCAWDEYSFESISEDTIILILGGGYFGDVWRNAWEFCLKGIAPYKDNKVIILPMSIYYENETLRTTDSDYLAEFKNLVICARDAYSYDLAKSFFHNKTFLVPDMAWCVKKRFLGQWAKPTTNRTLLLKRNDKELALTRFHIMEIDVDVHDWPTMEALTPSEARFKKLVKLIKKCQRKFPRFAPLFKWVKDGLHDRYYRKQMISRGVSFISSYDKVYTTRLHALILSVLLGKEVYIIDNSYGKLSACYSTWLKDVDRVYLFEKPDMVND